MLVLGVLCLPLSSSSSEDFMVPENNTLPVFGSRALSWSPPPGGFSFRVQTSPDLNFLFPSAELTTCADGGGAFCSVTKPPRPIKPIRSPEGKIRQIWSAETEVPGKEEKIYRKYRKTCIVEQMAVFYITDSGHLEEMYWDWTNRHFSLRSHYQNSTSLDEPKISYISGAFDTTLYALDTDGNLLQRCFDLPDHMGVECAVYGQNAPDNASWFWRRMNVGEVADVKFRGPIIPSSLDTQRLYMLSKEGQTMEIQFSENYAKWSTFHAPLDVRLMLLTDGQSFQDSIFAISEDGDLFSYNVNKAQWKLCGNPGHPLALYEGVAVNTLSKQALYLLSSEGSLVEYSVAVGTWRNLGHPQKCKLRTPPSASQLGQTMFFFLIGDNGALYSYDLMIKQGLKIHTARWTKHGLYNGRKLVQERVVALASDIVYMMTEDGEFVERSVDGVWNQMASLQKHMLTSDPNDRASSRQKSSKKRLSWRWKAVGPIVGKRG
mmetsp:Transcript_8388/g.11874  ORF Transcript_8388/g.11874 Transcript_8388/m.11874 type:complete len:490 (+) Transcript_8388:3-1472(+)